MNIFTLPTIQFGDTVADYCERVTAAATAHIREYDTYTIAYEAGVSVSPCDGVRGPALEWVGSVIGATCDRINETNPWENLSMHGCGDWVGTDDNPAGDVLADLADTLQDMDTYTDGMCDIADSMVPVYTHSRMVLYVDTLAYREDISDYGTPDNGIEAAGWALYVQAERICAATATEIAAVIRAALPQ